MSIIKRLLYRWSNFTLDGKFCGTCGNPTYAKEITVQHSQTTGAIMNTKKIRYCENARGNLPLSSKGLHRPWYGDQ